MALLDQNWGGLGNGDDENLEENVGGRQVFENFSFCRLSNYKYLCRLSRF